MVDEKQITDEEWKAIDERAAEVLASGIRAPFASVDDLLASRRRDNSVDLRLRSTAQDVLTLSAALRRERAARDKMWTAYKSLLSGQQTAAWQLNEFTQGVRMVDTIPSTNCAEWECTVCGEGWVSPSKWPCPEYFSHPSDS